MKRAQTHVIGPPFFKRHVATHHVDNVDAVDEVLYKTLGYGHLAIVTQSSCE